MTTQKRQGQTAWWVDKSTLLGLRQAALPGEIAEDVVRRLLELPLLDRQKPGPSKYRKKEFDLSPESISNPKDPFSS